MSTRTTPQAHAQTHEEGFTLVRIIEWMRRELSWHITSWEDIGSIINGPLLFVAALIAGVNQIEGGAVLAALPWVGPAWAILQIVGIDMQYMACARRTKDAVEDQRRVVAGLWFLLALVLAVPVLWANVTFSLQLMLGWSDAQAMSLLGLTPLMVALARAILQALLAFISAITRETRHHEPQEAFVHTNQPPTPPPPRGGKPSKPDPQHRKENRNVGISMAAQMQERERRIGLVQAYLKQHPGKLPSITQVTKMLGITSRSNAQAILSEARHRQRAG